MGLSVVNALAERLDVEVKREQKVWQQSCKQTNRVVMFGLDGRPIYDQDCKGSVVTADVSPDPIHVPEIFAEGLAPNRYMTFGYMHSDTNRIAMPYEVYADKQGKNLVAWFGVGL